MCNVNLLGRGADVQAVRDRMCEIEAQNRLSSSIVCASWKDEMNFQPNIDIHTFLNQWRNAVGNIAIKEVVYLSPDAPNTLPITSPPPRMVIVGMLIDRRITTNRSRLRAEETLKIYTVRLPLAELNVKELKSEEPLNVDVVMELMQRWWWNCDRLQRELFQNDDNGQVLDEKRHSKQCERMYRQCFLEAAAWAMKAQRERHPNRVVHIVNSS